MEKKELREAVLEIIKTNPGVTLNGIFRHENGAGDQTIEEALCKKFPPMYNVVKELKQEGVIKIDGKKKNTGHYLADVDIPENVPKATTSVKMGGGSVTYERPKKKATKRFVLEKHENEEWRTVDENDIRGPIDTLFSHCVRLVPQPYRVRDQETNEILDERQAPEKLPVNATA